VFQTFESCVKKALGSCTQSDLSPEYHLLMKMVWISVNFMCVEEFESQYHYLYVGYCYIKVHFDANDDKFTVIENWSAKLYLFIVQILISRCNKCSSNVKLTLFKSFCMAVYDVVLWKKFSVVVFNKFRSCWVHRRASIMSVILIDLCLSTVDIVVYNSCVLFA